MCGREDTPVNAVRRIGYWSSIATFTTAAGYSVVQLLQLARWLVFPWDELLIFGFSIGIPLPFVLAMAAFHQAMPRQRQVWTQCALVLAVMYAVLAVIVYSVQLALVVPAKLAGDASATAGLAVTAGTPMWVIDGAGYILMGLATLFAAGALAGEPSQRRLRWFLIANGVINPVIVAVYIRPSLLPLGALWIITAPGSMWLLARFFRQSAEMTPTGRSTGGSA